MEPELVLLEALLGVQGRDHAVAPRQLQEVESTVQTLEALGGVPDPTSSSLIEGSWQLIFTTRPGTSSPIQRTFAEDICDNSYFCCLIIAFFKSPAVAAGQVPRHYSSEPKGCAQPQQLAQELSVVAPKESTIFSNPCSIKGTLDIERSC